MLKPSLMLLLLGAIVLSACGGKDEKTTEAAAPTARPAVQQEADQPQEENVAVADRPSTDDETIAAGLELFRAKGCAGCHGMSGEGDIAPAMAGHTAEQMSQQVRNPQGEVKAADGTVVKMPAFTKEQLSDAQLDQMIAWVESLGPPTGEHAHNHDHGAHNDNDETVGNEMASAGGQGAGGSAEAAAHLRLAFYALNDGNNGDAEHHLADLVAVLEDEHVRSKAEEFLTALDDDVDAHELEHEMEQLMGEVTQGDEPVGGPQFHLQLALDGLVLDDLETVQRHVEHFREEASGVDKIKARETAELIRDDQQHEAQDLILELMGVAHAH